MTTVGWLRRHWPTLLISLIVGTVVWSIVGYEPSAGSHRISVEHVEATDAAGDDDETGDALAPVEVRIERSHGAVALWHEVFDPGWTRTESGSYVSSSDARPLVYAGQVDRDNLIVWSTPGGGTLRVVVDGRTVTEISEAGAAAGSIPISFSTHLQLASWLLLLASIAWCLPVIAWLRHRLGGPSLDAPTSRWARVALGAALPGGVWATMLIIFWPGLMNPDAVIQWVQVREGRLRDWHPYPMNVALGWFRAVIDTPWLPIGLLAGAAATLVGVATLWATDAGLPRWAVRSSVIAVAFSPVTSIMTVSLWKDVVMGVGVLALTLAIWRSEQTGGEWWLARRRNVAFAALACVVVWLSRHNGWPIVVGALLLVGALRSGARRGVAVVGGLSLLVVFVVRVPLFDAFDVEPSPVESIAYMQRISAHVNAGTELVGDEPGFLEQFRPLDVEWPYDCETVQPTWFGDDVIPWWEYEPFKADLRSLWLRMAVRNPGVEADHLSCSTQILWQPTDGGSYTYFLDGGTWAGFADTIPAGRGDLPLEAHASRSLARSTLDFYQGLPSPLIRPALYTYALIAAAAWATWRQRSIGTLLVISPAMIQTATVIPFSLVQDTRFQYGAILVAVVMTPLLIAEGLRPSAAGELADDARQPSQADALPKA